MHDAPGVMVYWEMFEMLLNLPEDQLPLMIRAIYRYASAGIQPDFEDNMLLKVLWPLVRGKLQADAARYDAVCCRNRIRGYVSSYKRSYAKKHGLDPDDPVEQEKYVQMMLKRDRISTAVDSVPAKEPTTATDVTPDPAPSAIPEETRKKEKRKDSPGFTPPTLRQVQDCCRDRGYVLDPQAFVSYYASVGWKVGKQPMVDWRAALQSWNTRRCKHGEAEFSELGPVGREL